MRERAGALGVALPPSQLKERRMGTTGSSGPGGGGNGSSAMPQPSAPRRIRLREEDPDVRLEDFSLDRSAQRREQEAASQPRRPWQMPLVPSDIDEVSTSVVMEAPAPSPSPSPSPQPAEKEQQIPSVARDHGPSMEQEQGETRQRGRAPQVTLADFRPKHCQNGPGFLGVMGSPGEARRMREEKYKQKEKKKLELEEQNAKRRPPTAKKPAIEPTPPEAGAAAAKPDRAANGHASGKKTESAAKPSKLSRAWNTLKRGTGKLLQKSSRANLREAKKAEEQLEPPVETHQMATATSAPWPPGPSPRPPPPPLACSLHQAGLGADIPMAGPDVASWLDGHDVKAATDRFTNGAFPVPATDATAPGNTGAVAEIGNHTGVEPHTMEPHAMEPQAPDPQATMPPPPPPGSRARLAAFGGPLHPAPTFALPPTPPRVCADASSELSLDSPSEQGREGEDF